MLSCRLACIATIVAVTGCAVTSSQFSQRKNTMSDTEICQAAKNARDSGNNDYIRMANEEGYRRNLTVEKCHALIAKSEQDNVIGAAALIGVAAIAVAVNQNDSSTAAPANKSNSNEYAWVRSYDKQRRLTWVCKETKTGKEEELYHCNNLPQK